MELKLSVEYFSCDACIGTGYDELYTRAAADVSLISRPTFPLS